MIELIPAIDLIDGKCVRLSQGDYDTKQIYNENPVEVAKEFEAYGIQRLHVVDLDGAASQHVVNYRVLDRIAGQTSLKIVRKRENHLGCRYEERQNSRERLEGRKYARIDAFFGRLYK